jgi:hypothetical protein
MPWPLTVNLARRESGRDGLSGRAAAVKRMIESKARDAAFPSPTRRVACAREVRT